MVFWIAVLTAVVFLGFLERKWTRKISTTFAYSKARDVFLEWRERNPGVYIGLSTEGRDLLAKTLVAYDEFVSTHSNWVDNGHRDFLVSLFHDLPPKHPDGRPVEKKSVKTDALYFIKLFQTFTVTTGSESSFASFFNR